MKQLAPYRGTLFRLALTNALLVAGVATVFVYMDTAEATRPRTLTVDSGPLEVGSTVKRERGLTPEDRRFLTAAAELVWEEVSVAQLGRERANARPLREFARQLAVEQTSARNRIETLAAGKGVVLPTGDSKSKPAEKTAASAGAAFDDAFVEWAATTQASAVKLFAEAERDCQDPELRQFASRMLPVAKAQHEQARRLRRALF